MSNRAIELVLARCDFVILLVGIIGLAVFFIACADHWTQKNQKLLLVFCLFLLVCKAGEMGVSSWHYWNRTNQFAQMIGTVPVRYREWTIEDDEYKPGVLWFGGAVAPRVFDGLGWCTMYETEGHRIKTLALDNQDVVFVDVYDDGVLDAVYPVRKKEGSYASILEKSKPRVPTESERNKYASLTAHM